MAIYKLEFEDSMIKQVKAFFKQLPQGVIVTEDKSTESKNSDFIEYLTNNPVSMPKQDDFLTRTDANER